MRSGSVSDQPTIELLCSLVAQRASGRLDVLDGAKKRSFWFEGGALSATRSNLKSESLERLREKEPGATDEELTLLQTRTRVRNTVALVEGEWTFTPNDPPSGRSPADLPALAWEALGEGLIPDALLKSRLASHMSRFPRLTGTGLPLDALPFGGAQRAFLQDIDGLRTLRDVLDFAPVPVDQALRAFYLALCCGTVAIQDGSAGARVQASATEVVAPLFEPPKDNSEDEIRLLRQERDRVNAAENDFQVLGIPWDASEAEYRKAYFRMARDFHPDRWNSHGATYGALAQEIFARLGEAWANLGDPEQRQATIDRVIHGKKTEEELAEEKVKAILAAENTFKLGLTEFRSGRIVQAHEQFRVSLERVPEELEYQAFCGYTTFRLAQGRDESQAQRGLDMVRSVTEQSPKMANAWALLGMAYNQQDQQDMARKALFAALKLEPTNPLAQGELKRLKRAMDKAEEEQKSSGGLGGFFSKLFGKK